MSNFACKLKIGDRSYGMMKMAPIDAAPFGLQVMKAISGVLSNPASVKALDSMQKAISSGGFKTDAKASAAKENIEVSNGEAMKIGIEIMSLFSSLDPDEISKIFQKALSGDVFVGDGDRLSDDSIFHEHFQKYAGDYYPVAIWATWNNVKDFFGGIGDGMKAVWSQFTQSPKA